MSSKTLLNLVLLLVVGILVVLVIQEPGKEVPPEPERLTELNPGTINRVRIERTGQATVSAERGEDGEWQLTEPRRIPANSHRFESLLKVAEAVTRSRFPVQDDLEKYGLSEPRVRLQLNGTTLAFGDTTPVDHRRYVRCGDSICLIGDSHYYHLIGGVGTFASQRVLPTDAGLEAIALPDLALDWREGQWHAMSEEPESSADAIAELVNNWKRARAIEVKAWDAPLPEGETIRVSLEGEATPVEFIVVSREPQTVLLRPDWHLAYHLPDTVAEGLFALPKPPQERQE